MKPLQHQSGKTRFGGALLLAVMALLVPQTGIAGKETEWRRERIAALFPPPSEGWQAGSLELEEYKTATSDLEGFTTGIMGAGVGVSVRLTARRTYRSGKRKLFVHLDTDDIEARAMINLVARANAAQRADLEKNGIKAITRRGHKGISARQKGETTYAFKVGKAGTVGLLCAYPGCTRDLDAMTARLDFSAIAAFLSFDHRRQKLPK